MEFGQDPPGRLSPNSVVAIDNEAQVLDIIRRTFEPRRTAVHVAPTGEAGLALVERHGADLDLIITELELPDLTGGEVAAIIAQYRPWLPVLYVGTSSVAPSPARSRPFLPKPFHPGDLEAAASRLLSRHAARRREMEALWRRATDAVEDTRRAMASNLAARGAMWQQLAQTGQLVAAGRELRRQERGSSGD